MDIELESPKTPPPNPVVTVTELEDKVDSILTYMQDTSVLLDAIVRDLEAIQTALGKGTP